jgi:hypothetical protein
VATLILSARAYADGVAGVVHGFDGVLWERIRRHTPGERPKAKALGYLDARTKATATTKATADPYGMTNKRTSNSKNKSNGKGNNYGYGKGGLVWKTFG